MSSFIFDIKRYAINDGPGIRITIFFKGCPLSCLWCHNPESISKEREKIYSRGSCIGCGSCVESCNFGAIKLLDNKITILPEVCTLCGECISCCPTKALEYSGDLLPVAKLMEEIDKESIFFENSEGGVTFSGGEPLMHSNLLIATLKECKKRAIHTVVDTSCYAKESILLEVAKYTDLFLIDLKVMDRDVHLKNTGVYSDIILKNIALLSEIRADFTIRIPLIKGVNSDIENIEATAKFLSKLKWRRREVELLIYHDVAKGKHDKLGSKYLGEDLSKPDGDDIKRAISIFAKYSIDATVRE